MALLRRVMAFRRWHGRYVVCGRRGRHEKRYPTGRMFSDKGEHSICVLGSELKNGIAQGGRAADQRRQAKAHAERPRLFPSMGSHFVSDMNKSQEQWTV